MKPKRILFPTDLSPNAETVLGHALFHAELHEAELHILHTVSVKGNESHSYLPDPEQVLEKMEESARIQIKESVERHKDSVFKILEKTSRGDSIPDEIMKYIQDHEIDLTIIGNHGRQGIKHFFLGSVAEEVVRMAACPVMIIRATEQGMTARKISKILAPVDFSEQSKLALIHASKLARIHNARLVVCHIIQNSFYPAGPDASIQPINELLPDLETSRKELLGSLTSKIIDSHVDLVCQIDIGNAYQEIVETAKREEADLIVMGSHGYSGLAHLVLGSTAERVMRMAPCPVLVVKLPTDQT